MEVVIQVYTPQCEPTVFLCISCIGRLFAHRITHRAISAHRLLFYLAASPGSRLLLKIKLDKAIRDYLGIFEMFTVAIGRLAFAEPPDWMREADRRTLEDASGPAQTLLAMVLSPEEEDTVSF